MNTSEFPTSISRNSPKHDFPLHNNYTSSNSNGSVDFNHYPSPGSPGGHLPGGGGGGQPPPPPSSAQQQDLTIDGIQNNFPHRRSRASRAFKNPPQPHMCIKEKTIDGKEVFINVLSWTRIANPDNPDAPIPLYGGIKVGKIPPGSPRMPPLVYAVMANPEVLKKAGRKCPDTPERMNLVDLICEFVEAMNPTLHLSRKPEILKDRDLSGELKDVWNAVQASRDKGRIDSGPPENLVVYTEFGPETAPSYEQSQQQPRHQPQQQQHLHYQQQEDFQLRLGSTQYDHLSYEHQTQHFHQQDRHSLGVSFSARPTQQPLTHDHYNNTSSKPPPQKHQQSAITNNSIEQNSEKQHPIDVPDSASSNNSEQLNSNNNYSDDDLINEIDSLKLSPAASGGVSTKSNGLTLPTGGGGNAPSSSTTENTAATSPSSTTSSSANIDSNNPVPVATKQQTSPTSPTQQQTATVSPTAATPPTPQKESKNSSSHNFFPMFRSSKSSSSSSNSDKSSSQHHNDKDKDKDGIGESTAPDTPVKTSSKKSGLNFFRRNKSSDSKKEQPSTPTKQVPPVASQQPTTAENNKLNLLVDESLMHHHHHMEGNNGTGEIIENSSATIAAK